MEFIVSVEKRMYAIGVIEIDCENEEQAIEKVQRAIDNGELQSTEIEWGYPRYEDCSFSVTGDVE